MSNPQDMSEGQQLRCAALTSIYMERIISGAIQRDSSVKTDPLVGTMTYVGAYGIGKGLSEKEAFADVEREKQRLLAELGTEEIEKEAISCLENVNWERGGGT